MGLGRAALLSAFITPFPSKHQTPMIVEEGSDEKQSEADSTEKDGPDALSMTVTQTQTVDGKTDDGQSLFRTTSHLSDDINFKPKHRYLPIISGLACPFSVLLDIPGLTERWYIKTEGYNVIDTQPNPILLDVGLGVSIAFGLIANIALVLRFLEKRPRQTTWVAIVALTIHDIINVTTVVVFGVIHRFNDGFTYGTAYWMCVASTACSLVCNTTLIIDLARTPNFNKNGSGLTEKQRSLVIAVMFLLCYLGLGSLVFSFIIKDPVAGASLTYINSLYFVICTISSVGFGDIYPISTAARVFSFFYDIAGLVLLAFTIAIARETVIETFEASYRHRREILAAKARARKEEKRKRAKERKERMAREMKEDPQGWLDKQASKPKGLAQSGGRGGAGAKASRVAAFENEKSAGISDGKAWLNRGLRKFGLMKEYTPKVDLTLQRTLTQQSLLGEESFNHFKKEIQKEQAKEFRLKIAVAMSLFWSFWLVGSAVFHLTEKWSYFDAMWFCFVFFTTIGYGDFSPKSSAGRAFFVAWSILGIATMTLLLSVVTETWSSRYHDSISESKVKRTIRRVRDGGAGTQANMKQLLALEGYGDEDSIEPKDLPAKLVDAVKGFHEHARYFMLGRTGDTPTHLRPLLEAADELDDELQNMKENGDMTETGANMETRHFLFMVSYERTFDMLMDAAENLRDVFKTHSVEIEQMRTLNDELRESITAAKKAKARHDRLCRRMKASETMNLPFGSRRPLGGDGDDEVEEGLIEELDDDEEEEKEEEEMTREELLRAATEAIQAGRGTLTADSESLVGPRASTSVGSDVLRKTSHALRRLSVSTPSRISLSRHDSVVSLSSLAMAPAGPPTSPVRPPSPPPNSTLPPIPSPNANLSMSRTPTLTFAEPEKASRPRSSSGIRPVGESKSRRGSTASKSNDTGIE